MNNQARKYNCIIIDDEPLAIKVIQEYVNEINALKCVGLFTRAVDAIALLNTTEVHLIFLDINMPGLSGIDFVKTLSKPPAIIFTTAYRNFAFEAFDLQALDYLLKPISYERFLKAVSRFFALQNNTIKVLNQTEEKEQFLILKADKKQHKISLKQILYVESLDNYIKVHTKDKTLICYMGLSAILNELPESDFVRIHRSFVVNISSVNTFTSAFVEISGAKIPIGRNYRDTALAKISS